MRLLVLSQIADWDFGPRVKAGGHEIVAWVRPTWARGERYSEGCSGAENHVQNDLFRTRTDPGHSNEVRYLDMA